MVSPRIGFYTSFDGARIAYAVSGAGEPVVFVRNFYSHLERDQNSPVWGHWFDELGRANALIRYDCRGSGLSDREVDDMSFDAAVCDLEALADHLQLKRFALAANVGGTPVAIVFAARHPERVARLILDSPYVRGRFHRDSASAELGRTFIHMLEFGWDDPRSMARHMLTSSLFIPDAPADLREAFDSDVFASMSRSNAARMFRTNYEVDVSPVAGLVQCPTLLLQALHSAILPFEEARFLASLITNARLVPLQSRNQILLAHEPAWRTWVSETRAFLNQVTAAPPAFDSLSPRELEILRLVAEGLDNAQIAARISISDKTVRNYVSSIYAKLGIETRAQAIVLVHKILETRE